MGTETPTLLPWRDGALYRRHGATACCAGPARLRVIGHDPTADHAASVVVARHHGVTVNSDSAESLADALDGLSDSSRVDLPREEAGQPAGLGASVRRSASPADWDMRVVVEHASSLHGEAASGVVRWPHPIGGGSVEIAVSTETALSIAGDLRTAAGSIPIRGLPRG